MRSPAVWIAIGFVLMSVAAMLLVARSYNWETAARIGDASALVAGAATVGALVVAFRTLAAQESQIERQLRYQRHGVLREAYREFLDALRTYAARVDDYGHTLGNNLAQDAASRASAQTRVQDAYKDVPSLAEGLRLVDIDEARLALAARLAKPIALEPGESTPEARKAHVQRLFDSLNARREIRDQLIASIVAELKATVDEG